MGMKKPTKEHGLNVGQWAVRVYNERDFGRNVAKASAGAAALASYLYSNDWVITACVGIIAFPVGKLLASAICSRWAQLRNERRSKDQIKELFDNLGREEKDVIQAFVWHGGTTVRWAEVDKSPHFSSAGIDSLISRDLIHTSITADGARDTFVLDSQLFEYAQSVLPETLF